MPIGIEKIRWFKYWIKLMLARFSDAGMKMRNKETGIILSRLIASSRSEKN